MAASPAKGPAHEEVPSLASSIPRAVCHLDEWSCTLLPERQIMCMDSSQTTAKCSAPVGTRQSLAACKSNGTDATEVDAKAFQVDFSAVDAKQLTKELGDPVPFRLFALNANTLIIARTAGGKQKAKQTRTNADDDAALRRIVQAWLPLAMDAKTRMTFPLAIPHAHALGHAADRINALKSPFFRAEDAGDRVQITVSGSPACEDLTAFVEAVHRLAWSTHPESVVARVYSLDAATASSLLNRAHEGASAESSTDKENKDASPATTQAGGDLVVFAEGAKLGDETAIAEQKRVLALLDLPRPEMIINGWVLQDSTRNGSKFGEASQLIRQTVNDHNARLQQTILTGWDYLKQAMTEPDYFDPDFFDYLTGATVLDNADYSDSLASPMQQRLSLARHVTVTGALGRKVCPTGQYCLGYTTLFQPLQPRLTNLLMAIIAAQDPIKAANCAVNRVEQVGDASGAGCHALTTTARDGPWAAIPDVMLHSRHADGKTPTETTMIENTARTMKLTRDVNDRKDLNAFPFCETADQVGILREEALKFSKDEPLLKAPPPLYLECFRRTVTLLLRRAGPQGGQPSTLGLTRRAIADFLFNYKMSQQYPHEFTAYDLTQSADAFNTALSPLIDAFNRDLTAYQNYLRTKLEVVLLGKHIASKDGFLNDGIVSVAVVSGRNASVNTTSVSYLDQSVAPDLSTLASALSGSGGGGGDKAGASATAANVAGKLEATAAKAATAASTGGISTAAQAALAGLATYQTTEVGLSRELNLSVTPRSTVGASGAEMDVELTSADSAAPKYWGGANAGKGDPDVSRVGTHHVSTHIRVDSVVLFDLSSFSAVLSKGRPLFPLLPPFVELPYVGTLAGIPLPAAKEYHSSSAIVSAVVVPTATDLAFGIRFLDDMVLDSNSDQCFWTVSRDERQTKPPYREHYCKARAAQSLDDLANQPVREFNRRKMQCMATEGYSSIPDSSADAAPCAGLQFADVLHTAQ